MTRSQLIEIMAAHIVSNARFWIGVGLSAEDAFTEAMKISCAGPVPQKIARERLGI